MTAALRFALRDEAGAVVVETDDHAAARYAGRYLLESGEHAGPLALTWNDQTRELERVELTDRGIVWRTTQGMRDGLEAGIR